MFTIYTYATIVYRHLLILWVRFSVRFDYAAMEYHKRMLIGITTNLHMGWNKDEIDTHMKKLKSALWNIARKEMRLSLLRRRF